MEPAEAVAYRSSLVESGAADEILRILVGLGEAHDRGEAASDAAAVQYILHSGRARGRRSKPPPGFDPAQSEASYGRSGERAPPGARRRAAR